MNIEEKSREKTSKYRKTILKEERLKKEKSVKVWKIKVENNDDSIEKGEIYWTVMSSEFVRKKQVQEKEVR